MAGDYKSHMSYKILDQVSSHIYDHKLTEEDHRSVIRRFADKGGIWQSVTSGDPAHMQKLLISLKSFMKSKRNSK